MQTTNRRQSYVCVCVCVQHAHTYIYVYIYIHVCVCIYIIRHAHTNRKETHVCVWIIDGPTCACACVRLCAHAVSICVCRLSRRFPCLCLSLCAISAAVAPRRCVLVCSWGYMCWQGRYQSDNHRSTRRRIVISRPRHTLARAHAHTHTHTNIHVRVCVWGYVSVWTSQESFNKATRLFLMKRSKQHHHQSDCKAGYLQKSTTPISR